MLDIFVRLENNLNFLGRVIIKFVSVKNHNVRSLGDLFHAGRQTDRQYETQSRF